MTIIDIIRHERFFDVLILILFACAFLRWAVAGDIGKAIYWLSALTLNVSVVFLIGGAK